MNITDFFKNDFCDYSAYDNYRKIACFVDGLKPSARKVIHTVLENKDKHPVKVSQYQSLISQKTNYIHGEQSLFGVIVGLAQDFVGSNNIPLLKREGNFGSRLIQEPSAGRYIYTCQEPILDKIFNPMDNAVLVGQEFEGDVIEPRFFVPCIPLILVNGSRGISTGFSQLILPRNIEDIVRYIKNSLEGKGTRTKMLPHFNGFKGTVVQMSENSFEIRGVVEVVNTSTIRITELPPEFDLATYVDHLNKLEDAGEIVSYSDLSNDDVFRFDVKMERKRLAELTAEPDRLNDMFKLTRKITENYTVLDDNLKIRTFDSAFDLLDAYIDIRKEFYRKRKEHHMKVFRDDLLLLISRYEFINGVVTDKIKVSKVAHDDIIKQLEKNKNIIRKDGSYEYLLQMPIHSLTKEKLTSLLETIKDGRNRMKEFGEMSIEQMWNADLRQMSRQ